MSSKKKSKVNKLSRMTEEEKQRYLQHRAAMEEEIQRRKQQLIASFLKTKLEHEEAFSRLNSAKINEKWRQILRQMKCKELKEDIITLQQRFEVALDCKNKLIESLLEDFNVAEFQYSMQFATHSETISKFLEVYQKRLSILHDWFMKQLQEMLIQNEQEVVDTVTEIQNEIKSLQLVREKSQQESENTLMDMKTQFDNKKNELQTKWLYKIAKLEEKYTDEINEIKQNYEAVIKKFKENNETKYAHYKILEKKDNSDTIQIINYFEQISKYTQKIKEAKREYEETESKHCNEINELKDEKKELANELMILQKKNTENHKNDRNQLKLLVNISTKAIQELKEIANKGAQIQQLSIKCAKLRNEKKIVLPRITPEEHSNNSVLTMDEKIDKIRKMCDETQRINDNLEKEKMSALEENKKLKKLLHFYMASARRSSSVPSK